MALVGLPAEYDPPCDERVSCKAVSRAFIWLEQDTPNQKQPHCKELNFNGPYLHFTPSMTVCSHVNAITESQAQEFEIKMSFPAAVFPVERGE